MGVGEAFLRLLALRPEHEWRRLPVVEPAEGSGVPLETVRRFVERSVQDPEVTK